VDPADALFTKVQAAFVTRQAATYGNSHHMYNVDLYNEM
jgi:hypothetical protein